MRRSQETIIAPVVEPRSGGAPQSNRGLLLVIAGVVLGGGALLALQTSILSGNARPANQPATFSAPTPAPAGAASEPAQPAADLTPAVVVLSPTTVAPSPTETTLPSSTSSSLEDVVSRVLPAVASISAGQSRGTGFFVRADQVLTNAHVVQGQSTVTLQVGTATYNARVERVSQGSDLALLIVNGANPHSPRCGSVPFAGARVGQEVIAVGSALGVLSNTVTRGIVSARAPGRIGDADSNRCRNQPGQQRWPARRSIRTRDRCELDGDLGAGRSGSRICGRDRSRGQPAERRRAEHDNADAAERADQSHGRPQRKPYQQRARGEQAYAQVLEWAGRNGQQLECLLGQVRRFVRGLVLAWRRPRMVCRIRAERHPPEPGIHIQLPELARHAPGQRNRDQGRSGQGR
jgi:hypothetical protein